MFCGQSVMQTYPKERGNASINSSAAGGAGGEVTCSLLGTSSSCRWKPLGSPGFFLEHKKAGHKKKKNPFLLPLRHMAAGSDNYPQHCSLSLALPSGGTPPHKSSACLLSEPDVFVSELSVANWGVEAGMNLVCWAEPGARCREELGHQAPPGQIQLSVSGQGAGPRGRDSTRNPHGDLLASKLDAQKKSG